MHVWILVIEELQRLRQVDGELKASWGCRVSLKDRMKIT